MDRVVELVVRRGERRAGSAAIRLATIWDCNKNTRLLVLQLGENLGRKEGEIEERGVLVFMAAKGASR